MAETILLDIPIFDGTKASETPDPVDVTYWKDRTDRVFYIDYIIDETMDLYELSKIIMQINREDLSGKGSKKPIVVFIQSYGGDLEQANYFCDLVQSSITPVITIATGVAMSAGFLILLSGTKRYAFRHSNCLVHQGSASISGSADQVESAMKNYQKQIAQMKEYILERTEIPEKVFNKYKTKDWYISAEELKEYKAIDGIIGVDCTLDEILK